MKVRQVGATSSSPGRNRETSVHVGLFPEHLHTLCTSFLPISFPPSPALYPARLHRLCCLSEGRCPYSFGQGTEKQADGRVEGCKVLTLCFLRTPYPTGSLSAPPLRLSYLPLCLPREAGSSLSGAPETKSWTPAPILLLWRKPLLLAGPGLQRLHIHSALQSSCPSAPTQTGLPPYSILSLYRKGNAENPQAGHRFPSTVCYDCFWV